MKNSTITRLTGVSHQTLGNWKKHKPELYKVIKLGCEVIESKKDKPANNAEYGNDGHWYDQETGERLP